MYIYTYIYPGSPTTICLKVGFRTTIILVGVYYHPTGTTIFKMVVDFQVQGMTHGNRKGNITHSIHVSCIYLHFVDVYGKCR